MNASLRLHGMLLSGTSEQVQRAKVSFVHGNSYGRDLQRLTIQPLLSSIRGSKVGTDLQDTFSRRLIYGLPLLNFKEADQPLNQPVPSTTFEHRVEKHNFDEGTFEGKVSASNWGVTRRQRVLAKISFESETFDIFDPQFSSDGESVTKERTSSDSSIEDSLLSEESKESVDESAVVITRPRTVWKPSSGAKGRKSSGKKVTGD